MTNEEVEALVQRYDAFIVEKLGPHPIEQNIEARTGAARAGHLRWMLQTIPLFIKAGHTDKAMRWLGFIQGVFFAWDLSTIEEMKKDNA